MSRDFPIKAAYQALLSKGRLKGNPSQVALVDHLSQLQQRLIAGTLNTQQNKSGIRYKPNGIYIYGGVGTGKSRIADLFASSMPAKVSTRRVHFHEFMINIHMRLHRARSKNDYRGDPLVEIGQQVSDESSVLCLDEFQVSDIADAMILRRLFGSFWASGGFMISTSNRHPTELYKNGLNRPLFIPFIEELQLRCEIWEMKGDYDYRTGMVDPHSKTEKFFFTNAQEFEVALVRAAGNTTLEAVSIPVMMNRTLEVRATKPTAETNKNEKAIVQATFPTLCEANLGTSDYHALCNFSKSIYLSGLRKFASDELDFVRRFITLVDIAYETKTRVICLSSVPLLEVFENIIMRSSNDHLSRGVDSADASNTIENLKKLVGKKDVDKSLTVRGEGGSSSSMMSTFINEVEWSATGLKEASLATGGAGETDVRFAAARAISRLTEMNSAGYGILDD